MIIFGTGCATIVTTTDDEGLKYNNYEWQYLEAWREGINGYLRLNNKWTGVTYDVLLLRVHVLIILLIIYQLSFRVIIDN